jgi:hypothetical protein
MRSILRDAPFPTQPGESRDAEDQEDSRPRFGNRHRTGADLGLPRYARVHRLAVRSRNRRGSVHGLTDPIGLRAAVDPVHVHDLHATILHLLGLDHTRLTFPHNGREERLTDTAGKVVRSILA